MAFHLHIDGAAQLVTVSFDGDGDFAEIVAVVRAVAADPAYQPEFAILVDTLAYEYVPPIEDARRLSDVFRELRSTFRGPMAAVVGGGVKFGTARMIAQLLELLGFQIDVFHDRASALTWIDSHRALPR